MSAYQTWTQLGARIGQGFATSTAALTTGGPPSNLSPRRPHSPPPPISVRPRPMNTAALNPRR